MHTRQRDETGNDRDMSRIVETLFLVLYSCSSATSLATGNDAFNQVNRGTTIVAASIVKLLLKAF
jgi:hypothetical protein